LLQFGRGTPESVISQAMQGQDADFEIVRAILRRMAWPGVEEGTSYGTPALKVRGKLLLRLREPDVLVLSADPDYKEFLLQLDPEVFYETDHYRGWPYVLVRLSRIAPDELADHIEHAWRRLAPAKLVAGFDKRNRPVES